MTVAVLVLAAVVLLAVAGIGLAWAYQPTGRHHAGQVAVELPLLQDCPACQESVSALAERCRYCGVDLPEVTEALVDVDASLDLS